MPKYTVEYKMVVTMSQTVVAESPEEALVEAKDNAGFGKELYATCVDWEVFEEDA